MRNIDDAYFEQEDHIVDHESEESSSSNQSRPEHPKEKPGRWWIAPSAFVVKAAESSLSYSRASKEEESELWLAAIRSAMDSLMKNETPSSVPREHAGTILTYGRVFKRKECLDQHGLVYTK